SVSYKSSLLQDETATQGTVRGRRPMLAVDWRSARRQGNSLLRLHSAGRSIGRARVGQGSELGRGGGSPLPRCMQSAHLFEALRHICAPISAWKPATGALARRHRYCSGPVDPFNEDLPCLPVATLSLATCPSRYSP